MEILVRFLDWIVAAKAYAESFINYLLEHGGAPGRILFAVILWGIMRFLIFTEPEKKVRNICMYVFFAGFCVLLVIL